jgi:hypothetical protein
MTRDQPDLECFGGGPYDGSCIPSYAQQIVAPVFQNSLVFHVYNKTIDSDGTAFYLYAGCVVSGASVYSL